MAVRRILNRIGDVYQLTPTVLNNGLAYANKLLKDHKVNLSFRFVTSGSWEHRLRSKELYLPDLFPGQYSEGTHAVGLGDLPGDDIWVHSGYISPGHSNKGTTHWNWHKNNPAVVGRLLLHELLHNFGQHHNPSNSCLMFTNSSKDSICNPALGYLRNTFGTLSDPEPPAPKKIKHYRIWCPEVTRGNYVTVYEDGTEERTFIAGKAFYADKVEFIRITETCCHEQP